MSMEVHADFSVIHNKRHLSVIDLDNGVSVVSDLDYVVRALHSSRALRPHMKVLLRDAFGGWDVIDLDEPAHVRGLDAATETEALLAA